MDTIGEALTYRAGERTLTGSRRSDGHHVLRPNIRQIDDDKLAENARALADAVQKARPTGAKGTYMKGAAVSSTMGPGIRVEVSSLGV